MSKPSSGLWKLSTNGENRPVTIAEDRVLDLVGGRNFREVGGYPTRDGRLMKRGLVWRSARLDGLTTEDISQAALQSICTVADLRLEEERTRNPTAAAFAATRVTLAWDTDYQEITKPERLFEEGLDTKQYADAVREFYRGLAIQHRKQLTALFRHVAGGGMPILIHCTAGKDRTGLAVALLLELIGVERTYVIADYCKTSALLDWNWLTTGAAAAGMQLDWLESLPPQALEALMRADQSYIVAALEELEILYGSIEMFALKALQLSTRDIELLKMNLLE